VTELELLTAENESLRAACSSLIKACSDLQQDWAIESTRPLTPQIGRIVFERCARELRIVLSQGELPTRSLSERPTR